MEFNNLKRQYERLKERMDQSIVDVMTGTRFIGGK